MKVYIDGTQAWAELHDDHTVISWPNGHRVLGPDATLTDLLAVLSFLIEDVRAEREKGARDKTRHDYRRGYDNGWSDGHRGRAKSA